MQVCGRVLGRLSTSAGRHTCALDLRNSVYSKCSLRHRPYASLSASNLQFGQPLHETHPHLLQTGEREIVLSASSSVTNAVCSIVTPGITALEYAQRRTKLASKLPHNGIAIIASSNIKYRSGAVFYEFHQDSNFFYLTGIAHAQALQALLKSNRLQ